MRIWQCILLLVACTGCGRDSVLYVEKTLRVGAQPMALALSSDGKTLAVSCSRSNDVWLLELGGGSSRRVDVGGAPAGLLFDRGRRLWVTESGADSVAQLDLDEHRIKRRFKVAGMPVQIQRLQGPDGSGDNDRLMVVGRDGTGIGIVDGSNFRPEKTILVEGAVTGFSGARDGRSLFAVTKEPASIIQIRVSDLSPQVALLVGGIPVDLALSRDGRFAWVAGRGHSFDQSEEERAPEPGQISLVRLADFLVVDHADVSAGIRAMLLSHSGRFLFLLCDDENEFQVLDAFSFKLKARLTLHGSPASMVLSADGRKAFVAQRDLKQVAVVPLGAWR